MTLIRVEEEQPDNKSKTESNEQADRTKNDSQWGYDMYPERRQKPDTSRLTALLKGRDNLDKMKCERNVYQCVKQSPIIRLLMGALSASGCPVDIRRHISCEACDPSVSGGYDPIFNQVVICQNVVKKKSLVQAVLMHEMIHMFDFCRHNLNFRNLDHLACTEIRAANLAHCSFLAAWLHGDVALRDFKEGHQHCVKNKAISSIVAARNVTEEQARHVVDKVFPQCYADLEPVGRRIRRNSDDMLKALKDGFYYGYD